jgi:hypothetical protein
MNSIGGSLILRKYCEEGTLLMCEGRLFGVSFIVRGRFSKVTTEGVIPEIAEFVSLDNEASFALTLSADGLTFRYVEPRDFPSLDVPSTDRTTMGLVVEFPDRGLVAVCERMTFVEIPDE